MNKEFKVYTSIEEFLFKVVVNNNCNEFHLYDYKEMVSFCDGLKTAGYKQTDTYER